MAFMLGRCFNCTGFLIAHNQPLLPKAGGERAVSLIVHTHPGWGGVSVPRTKVTTRPQGLSGKRLSISFVGPQLDPMLPVALETSSSFVDCHRKACLWGSPESSDSFNLAIFHVVIE